MKGLWRNRDEEHRIKYYNIINDVERIEHYHFDAVLIYLIELSENDCDIFLNENVYYFVLVRFDCERYFKYRVYNSRYCNKSVEFFDIIRNKFYHIHIKE